MPLNDVRLRAHGVLLCAFHPLILAGPTTMLPLGTQTHITLEKVSSGMTGEEKTKSLRLVTVLHAVVISITQRQKFQGKRRKENLIQV